MLVNGGRGGKVMREAWWNGGKMLRCRKEFLDLRILRQQGESCLLQRITRMENGEHVGVYTGRDTGERKRGGEYEMDDARYIV